MKKIVSLALVAVMLLASLVISANAATPFGTVVEIPVASDVPSMEYALPDASWGEKVIHIDKNSPNAGITQYKPSGKVKENLSFDLYGRWTDTTLYLCFVSPDTDFRGNLRFWWGDGVQMVIVPGIVDISYCNGVSMGWTNKAEFEPYDWAVTFDVDDETPVASDVADGNSIIYGDEKSGNLVVKFAIPKEDLGYKKSESLKSGALFSFALNRIDGSDEDPHNEAYVGWLEWGDFFNVKKGWNQSDTDLYVPSSENPKTTSANTFKLVGEGGSAPAEQPETPATPEQPETPATPAEKPSSWAEAEVTKAIEAGLVPADLQSGYTKGISRANLSKILSALIDKVYGKAADKSDANFGDTTDADVLKAANLGIINGYKQNDGTYLFKPDNTLKRSEMSAIINRVAKLCGVTTTGFEAEVKFEDTASHWCNAELGWPVHTGIVKGTSATAFSPENTLTVEQTIMMVYRTFEALK